MSNVSFGGNWAEELTVSDELRLVLFDLEWAVQNCRDMDVNTEAVQISLEFVRQRIEKGAMLVDAFQKARQIENQNLRYERMQRVYGYICDWAGV